MPVKYNTVDWAFDKRRWAHDLNQQRDVDLVAAQELSGLTASAWYAWLNPLTRSHYEQPRMYNFLKVCNLLDLDPRNYFCLALPEDTNG